MDWKKLSVITAIFSLAQAIASPVGVFPEISQLNPPVKTNLNDPNIIFKCKAAILCEGLSLYKLDAIERCAKEEIIEQLGRPQDGLAPVRFDLDHMDIGRKGWTRYYPFSSGGKDFIIRIFLTAERAYQPKVEVLFEGSIGNPPVTFQILPGLNSILKDCRIKPHNFYSSTEAARNP